MSCNALPAIQAGYIEYVPETAQTFPAEQSSGPTCAARNCTVGIPNVLGGTSDCAGKVTYETCTVEASLGYTLQAGESNTLLCQAGGAFNQTAPTILPGTCADPSFDAGVPTPIFPWKMLATAQPCIWRRTMPTLRLRSFCWKRELMHA
eukprot:g10875.t1